MVATPCSDPADASTHIMLLAQKITLSVNSSAHPLLDYDRDIQSNYTPQGLHIISATLILIPLNSKSTALYHTKL